MKQKKTCSKNTFFQCNFTINPIVYFIFTANDELLKAFGRSKDGNIRVIKASIEKGN